MSAVYVPFRNKKKQLLFNDHAIGICSIESFQGYFKIRQRNLRQITLVIELYCDLELWSARLNTCTHRHAPTFNIYNIYSPHAKCNDIMKISLSLSFDFATERYNLADIWKQRYFPSCFKTQISYVVRFLKSVIYLYIFRVKNYACQSRKQLEYTILIKLK